MIERIEYTDYTDYNNREKDVMNYKFGKSIFALNEKFINDIKKKYSMFKYFAIRADFFNYNMGELTRNSVYSKNDIEHIGMPMSGTACLPLQKGIDIFEFGHSKVIGLRDSNLYDIPENASWDYLMENFVSSRVYIGLYINIIATNVKPRYGQNLYQHSYDDYFVSENARLAERYYGVLFNMRGKSSINKELILKDTQVVCKMKMESSFTPDLIFNYATEDEIDYARTRKMELIRFNLLDTYKNEKVSTRYYYQLFLLIVDGLQLETRLSVIQKEDREDERDGSLIVTLRVMNSKQPLRWEKREEDGTIEIVNLNNIKHKKWYDFNGIGYIRFAVNLNSVSEYSRKIEKNSIAKLTHSFIIPMYQGYGLGKVLYQSVFSLLKSQGVAGVVSDLNTRVNKDEVPRLWRRFGSRFIDGEQYISLKED